jgi:5-(aminomethyl)-3-furanmethanol phosphate kinase
MPVMLKREVLHLVKVGGSLLRTGQHQAVMLRVLEHCYASGEVPIFLMGGGAMADAVRELCATHHASMQAEHAMSLLAMQQNAQLVASQFEMLIMCDSVDQAFERVFTHTPGIWYSIAHINGDILLESSNSITSDSIALYLAQALCVHAHTMQYHCDIQVTLLKSCAVQEEISCDAKALSSQHIVDEAFPEFAFRLQPYANAAWRVVNAQAAFMASRT